MQHVSCPCTPGGSGMSAPLRALLSSLLSPLHPRIRGRPTKGPLQLVGHDFLCEHLLNPRAVRAHPMSDALQILPANSYANYLISRLIYFLRHRGIVFSALPCLPEAAGPQGWEEARAGGTPRRGAVGDRGLESCPSSSLLPQFWGGSLPPESIAQGCSHAHSTVTVGWALCVHEGPHRSASPTYLAPVTPRACLRRAVPPASAVSAPPAAVYL